MAVRLERDLFSEDQRGGSVLGSLPIGLAFLRAIDAAEADAFRLAVVQNVEGVAVEDGNDGAGEVSG
jgi:hypothetical protein